MNIANRLTMLRVLLIPVFIVFFYINMEGRYIWAAAVFIAASLTDLLDGYLARKHKIVTRFGKLVDPMADKLLVGAALILLTVPQQGLTYTIHPVITIVLISRELIVSAFRVVAAAEGLVLAADNLGKAKTVVQIVAIAAILLNDWFFAALHIPFGMILIYASVILSVWSLVHYMVKNKSVFKSIMS
jgi:CDP-diacylglycerol--glycerol-3-phosphate 3-phosphatidyltransferase